MEPPLNRHVPDPAQASQENINTWAAKLQNSLDRKIKNHVSPTLTSEGIPRVKIPDSVFQRGAELHKDFVLGVFMGKAPSYGHIQSILSHIWDRGMKLEIHLRPATRSMLVRIPNATIRQKIVEQEIWHIGNSLFYVAQWSSTLAIKTPSFTSIPLWAHVRGIPFDLYTQEGLGHVADLIGLPVEVDDFTKRMSSLEVAHLKVKVDCTKPLPTTAEIERENGEIVRVSIDYPWTPPICPCCKELGHLESLCPNAKWTPKVAAESSPVPPSAQKMDSQSPSTPGPKAQPDVLLPQPVIPLPPPVASTPAAQDKIASMVPIALSTSFPSVSGGSPASPASPAPASPEGLILTQSIAVSVGLPAHYSSRPKPIKVSKKAKPSSTVSHHPPLLPQLTFTSSNQFSTLATIGPDLSGPDIDFQPSFSPPPPSSSSPLIQNPPTVNLSPSLPPLYTTPQVGSPLSIGESQS